MSKQGQVKDTPHGPLVSVLIPCFNHEKYIERCLESTVEDGFQNIEVVIIDDGSSDRSYEKAASWVARNAQHFAGGCSLYKQANKGVVRTLNQLIAYSKGDYFVLLAGDDELLPGGIECRLTYLKNHGELLAVFGDARGIDDEGNVLFSSVIKEKFNGNTRALSDVRARPFEIILNWCVPGPVFMADRRIVEEIGLYAEEFKIEDRDYYLRIISADKLGYVNQVVAAYRIHAAALTGTRERQRLIGSIVAEIDRKRLALFRGRKALALYLSWRGNASRLSDVRFPRKAVVIVDIIFAKAAAKLLLSLYRAFCY